MFVRIFTIIQISDDQQLKEKGDKEMRKKAWLGKFLAVSLTFAIALTGCSSGNTNTSGDANNSKQEASEPKEGGTLIVARLSDAENLDPQFSSTINAASVFHHTIYEGLVQRDKNMEFQPMLAKEWNQPDEWTWEFKLREDVVFHDGTPLTSEAVKKTFERVLDKEVASPKAGLFKMIKEVKAIDEYTVQFILTEPFSPLLSILANHEGGILSPKAIEQFGKQLSQNPVGTGPFKFQAWTAGQEIQLVKNEQYWGKQPKVDKVVYRVVPEDTTRVAMVQTGEAHIAEPVPVTEIERIQGSKDMELYRSSAFGTEFIGFNFKSKPFDDIRVRQAINYAIESNVILQGVYNNVGSKANSLLGPQVFGYHKDLKGYEYNVNKAKQLLAEAGYPNGFKTSLVTMDQKERVNLAEVVQSQLKGIGIELEVKVMEYGAFVSALGKGESEMFISSWRNATGDADYNQYHLFHGSSHGASGNYFFYTNEEVDKLIEEGRLVSDSEKRKEIYAKLQEIQEEEAVFIPVRILENIAATNNNVQGLYINPSGYLMVNEVTVK